MFKHKPHRSVRTTGSKGSSVGLGEVAHGTGESGINHRWFSEGGVLGWCRQWRGVSPALMFEAGNGPVLEPVDHRTLLICEAVDGGRSWGRLFSQGRSDRLLGLGTLSSGLVHFHPTCNKKLIQKHFHPKTLSSKTISSKTEDNFIHDTFIQKRVHPMTLSSKNGFVQRHFRPKPVSSNDTFIQNLFHPKTLSSKNTFIQ